MANVTITQLPQAGPILGTESVPIVQNGQTVQTTTAAIAASPSQTYQYLTVIQTPNLPNSRYLSAGSGLLLTDNGAQSTYTISLDSTLSSFNSALAGVMVKTNSSTVTNRFMSASGAGITVTNGDGVAGNPTYSLTGNVASLANASGNGMLTFINGIGVQPVTIVGTASEIDVANGTGVSGNPTIGLADNPVLPGVAGVKLPAGTSAERDVAPTNGTLRYNTDTATLEAYANSSWGSIVSGSGVTSVNVSGGTTGLTTSGGPITSSGTITFAGTLITSNGGTGLSSYTAGDITYYASGTALSKLAIGSSTFVLTSSGTAPQWSDPTGITVGTATNVAGGAANRIVYNTASGTTSFVVAPTVANTYLEWSGSAFQWSSNPLGTVTSVDVSGGTTGLTTSGGPITSSGTITLAGTLAVANGGTGQTSYTDGQLLIGNSTGNTLTKATLTAGTGITVTNGNGSISIAAINNGTVTSVDASGGTTGLSFSGGPITTSGTLTLAGTLITSNGGTGLTTYTAGDIVYYATGTALSKLGIGSSTYILTSSGTAPQWSDPTGVTVGTATNATNVAITASSANADYFVPLATGSTSANYGLLVASGPTINPSTGKITAGISGGTF